MYLYKALLKYKRLNRVSMHTPGHKNLFEFDYTELPDTDSLFEASGPIKESEERASQIFNTKSTFFSAGGCTLCIQAMLRLIAPNGGKVVFGRTIHKSAINAAALLGIDPVFVFPRQDAGEDLPGRIYVEDIIKVLDQNKEVKGVYITSPDYFGVMSDIKKISEECKKRNIPLVVDNAHGTHLKFLSEDLHPITLGATITADSAHKTLPVLTGGAFLQIGDSFYTKKAKEAMSLFGSTSPSYPVMASLDICCDWLNKNKNKFKNLEKKVKEIKNLANKLKIKTPKKLVDPIRISLNTKSIGVSGEEAADFFRVNGIEPEYANESYVILIPSVMNSNSDFEKLKIAMQKLPELSKDTKNKFNFKLSRNPKKLTPREVLLKDCEELDLEKSENKTCGEVLCPCPPGIPVVMPGEIITLETIELLKKYDLKKIKVLKGELI